MNGVLLGLLAYVLVQLAVGAAVSRQIRTESDYLLAGRSLGPVLATFSIFATWFGAETCIGAAGAFYAEGLAGGAADPFGYAICLAVMGLVLAVPLWRRGLTTLADLFRARYGPSVERLAVIVIAPSSVLWAAAQVRAFGQVLAASSALEVEIAIAIAAGVVILYTAMGGLLADAMTDVVQGIAVLLGLALLLPLVLDPVTGVVPALAASAPERLDPLGGESPTVLAALDRWAIPICGSLVAQELVSRVIASRTPTLARNASLVAAAVYFAVGLIPASIGLLGPALVPGLTDPEQILPLVAQQHLPVVLYVLFAGALVSAILSTVDSALLAAASLVSHNLILPLVPGTSEAGKVRLARGGVVAFGFLAWAIALQEATVYDLVEAASALGSAGVFVIVVLGLFTRIGGPRAASAALVTGCAVWIGATATEVVSAPYLAALGTAFAAYFAFAAFEARATAPGV